jgi:diadenosine tetraphosphate (Ap4A) HIT family hydrolase
LPKFLLDPGLKADCLPICDLNLCQLLLMDDCRWPWVILVPRIENAVEIHQLDASDQALLQIETSKTADILAQVSGCEKINAGALGNIVRQLHVHVIARSTGDENWPGPVWGFGQRQPYQSHTGENLTNMLRKKLG